MVAIFDFFLNITSQLFEELNDWNSEFKLMITKSITENYFDTKLSRFRVVGFPMVAIIYF